jgi:hypothetical protein
MTIEMFDEAYLKKLDDQDIGEGPLILTAVDAYVQRKTNRDLYKGKLPYNLAADMTRDAVRKVLGTPKVIDDQTPADLWSRDKLEIMVRYSQDLKLGYISVGIPEFQ